MNAANKWHWRDWLCRPYALPVFLPGAIASAVAFDIPGHIRRAAVATLLAAIFVGQVMLVDIRRNEGSREMLDRMVAAMNGHPGCLLVFKGHPILYHFSDRCRLSRFWMPAHLDKANEAQALGIDVSAETRRILSRKPGLIVLRSTRMTSAPISANNMPQNGAGPMPAISTMRTP